MTKEIIVKPYLPRPGETREEALARVREAHGTPKLSWEDRPVRNFNLPDSKGVMERIRGHSRKLAPAVAALALAGAGYEVISYSLNKDHQVQQIQNHKDKQAIAKGEKAQEQAGIPLSP